MNIQDYITRAKQNDQRAFTAILEHYWDMVYNFQLSKGNNGDDAEDICIETFSKVFDKIETYDTSYHFKNWVLTISRNIHIDFIRKNKNHKISEVSHLKYENKLLDESISIENEMIQEQQLDVLQKNIKKLKPHYQKIIQLRYFQELSHAQIADILGESLSNIKVKSHRAKKLLEQLIQKGIR